MIFGYVKEKKQQIIGIKTINKMNIDSINKLHTIDFIETFKNIFEKTKVITIPLVDCSASRCKSNKSK